MSNIILTDDLMYILLNWDKRYTNGEDFDLDLMLLLLDKEEKILSNEHFIFFNNTNSKCKSVVLEKQSNSGCELEDEKIKLIFTNLVEKIAFIDILITIEDSSGKNFGQVKNAVIKLIDSKNTSLYEENLSEDFSRFKFCKLRLFKDQKKWSINKLEPLEKNSLEEILVNYGIKLKK